MVGAWGSYLLGLHWVGGPMVALVLLGWLLFGSGQRANLFVATDPAAYTATASGAANANSPGNSQAVWLMANTAPARPWMP